MLYVGNHKQRGVLYTLFLLVTYNLYNMLAKKPRILHVDLETWGSENLKKCGLYRYVMADDFQILIFAFSVDGKPAVSISLALGQTLPQQIIDWLLDPEVIKKAWKADFEIACLSRYLGKALDPSQWRCTMVKAAYNGLPLGLDATGAALKLDKQKMTEGKELIKFFCVPCKPTKRNEMRTRNYARDHMDKFKLFAQYARRDVDVECAIDQKLILDLPPREQQLYALDQSINRRGFMVDRAFVSRAVALDEAYRAYLTTRAIQITGVENPRSVQQLLKWLCEEVKDYSINSLDKKKVAELLKSDTLTEASRALLEIRKELALSAVKKYTAMLNFSDGSGCIRGGHQYYGATRTGRWAGRGVQIHNFARNALKPKPLAFLRKLVNDGIDHHTLSMMYDSVSGCLKELLRTAIVPGAYKKLVVGDFSAIEAVVLAWLAGEQWRLKAFEAKKDIYIASASRMFSIPEGSITKDSPMRQTGKVTELSLGYQGGVNALLKMAQNLGIALNSKELPGIVSRWRLSNKAIVKSWETVQAAFKYALLHPGEVVACLRGILKFQFYKGKMLMKLPSGRSLVYDTPELLEGQLTYYGQNQTTKRWEKISIYGGKIIENAVQAIARDLLADAMLRVDKAGYSIVLHVHDELVCEVPQDFITASESIEELMTVRPSWGQDIPIRAEVFETTFYRK